MAILWWWVLDSLYSIQQGITKIEEWQQYPQKNQHVVLQQRPFRKITFQKIQDTPKFTGITIIYIYIY
jgi:hypothetical protein